MFATLSQALCAIERLHVNRRSKLIFCIIALGVLLLVFSILQVYVVRDAAGGTLFWSDDQGYLFLNVVNRGYRFSYVGYICEFIKEALRGVPSPDDHHSSIIVFQLTPGGVQRYTNEGLNPGVFWMVDNTICVRDLDSGELWEWTGMRFDRASKQVEQSLETQQQSFRLADHPSGPDFDNMYGWGGRYSILNGPYERKFTIQVHGKQITVAAKGGFGGGVAYIDFVRPNQTPEKIWYLDEHTRRVSKAEYEQFFAKP